MSLLEQAKHAFSLLQQGREALDAIKDAVSDGSAAINTKELGELRVMLEREEQETKDVINDARTAIADYRAGG
jgi:hypothetical protein